jgi:hypothetical protein
MIGHIAWGQHLPNIQPTSCNPAFAKFGTAGNTLLSDPFLISPSILAFAFSSFISLLRLAQRQKDTNHCIEAEAASGSKKQLKCI